MNQRAQELHLGSHLLIRGRLRDVLQAVAALRDPALEARLVDGRIASPGLHQTETRSTGVRWGTRPGSP
jgi:hypothetical protein